MNSGTFPADSGNAKVGNGSHEVEVRHRKEKRPLSRPFPSFASWSLASVLRESYQPVTQAPTVKL